MKIFLVQQALLDYWIREGLHCVSLASPDVNSYFTYMHAIVHVFSVVSICMCTIFMKTIIDSTETTTLRMYHKNKKRTAVMINTYSGGR